MLELSPLLTFFIYNTQLNNLHIFRTANILRLIILWVGGAPTPVLLHQVGPGQGLLHHCLGLLPHIPHDG